MSELKLISPLLDNMSLIEEIPGHNGCTCYSLRHVDSGERFVVKHISIPASDRQVHALLLSGAYPDEAAIHAYYGTVAEDIKAELEAGRRLADSGYFAGARAYQVEPKESGVGYDVYILYPRLIPLQRVMVESAMTSLRAVNLGLDLCEALSACREAGYLFENLKPENVFLTNSGRFQLGDLGLTPLQDLQYASVPEEYLGPYSAPELYEITASPNTTIDLYALGMLLYRIYNGNHGPFEDENTGAAMADKLRVTGRALPTPIYADYELAEIILKACSPDPESRYQTPDELKQALTYYTQRNELSDELIVPPIVSSPITILEEEEPEPEEEPIRFTSKDSLDEDFRRSFSPDLSGAGTEEDIDDASTVSEPVPVPAAPPAEEAEDAPVSEKEAAEPIDADQMDLDSFLASISDVVGGSEAEGAPEEPVPAVEEAQTYIDSDSNEELDEPESEKRKMPLVAVLCVILGVLLLLGAAVFFLLRWYFVDITALHLSDATTSQLTVDVETDDNASYFTVLCTDIHGNAYPVNVSGTQYTFTGLTENTSYTISVRAAEHHRLSSASATELYITTPESTEITNFTSSLAEADGEVFLSLSYIGPAPVQWKLSYVSDGGDSGEVSFTGSSYRFSALKLNQTYTFTLESTENIYLSGNVSTTLEVIPIVRVSKLNVTEINGTTVKIQWETEGNLPSAWTVSCEAGGFNRTDEAVTATEYTIQLPDLRREYIFYVNAPGMSAPASVVLPSDPNVVTDLTATADASGTAVISWTAVSGSPAGGWYVTYGNPTSTHEPTLTEADGTSVTLTGLIPDATYTVTLKPADGTDVFGYTETTFDVPDTVLFNSYGVSSKNTFISLWEKPAGNNWTYSSLSNSKKTFSAEEGIAVCLQVSNRDTSTDSIGILYVIRDADGNVVSDASTRCTWNEMWYRQRHASAVPNPGKSGSYTLEIYVNRQLLKSIGFKIS